MSKRALITGITGQDGAYLAELLLDKGYEVHGIKRRASSFNTDRIDHLYQDPHERGVQAAAALRRPDRRDESDPHRAAGAARRDLQSRGPESRRGLIRNAGVHGKCDALGTLRLLEAIRILGLEKRTRFYQASTSEMFGKVSRRRSGRRRRSILAHPMVLRRCTGTGSP